MVTKTKKSKQQVSQTKVFIKSSFNNTLITVTDMKGNVLAWGSAGARGFSGTRKSTPYAASIASDDCMRRAKTAYGISEVEIYVSGVGVGRDSAVRAIGNTGVVVTLIKDITPIPHNGCRPKKPRRV
jgi:small subunit ribosomal protein S11